MDGHQRTVKAVVTTYVGPDDVPRVGLRGEQIQVGDKHLEAFDESEAQFSAPAPVVEEPVVDETPAPKRRAAKKS